MIAGPYPRLELPEDAAAAETLAREAHRYSEAPSLWFLLPARLGRWRPWLAGACAGGAVIVLFCATTTVLHGLPAAVTILTTPTVASTLGFFLASLALLAGLAQVIFPAARRDIEDLVDTNALPQSTLDAMAEAMQRLPARSAWAALPPAMVIGSLHVWLLGEPTPYLAPWLAGSLCNLLLWIAMFQIAVPLLRNARLFRLLGQCTRVDLYRPARLRVFGRTAIRPCLFIIALQCAYAILLLPEGTSLLRGGAPIGLIASMSLVAALFFLPLRGIRARIRATRVAALRHLDQRLARQAQPDSEDATDTSLAATEALLALRQRIFAVSSWPLGLEGVRRMLFYLVLVPLTWIGAALVEMMIDASL